MDSAMSVAVDPTTGCIFVAGRRQVSASESEFIVVKFSSAGKKKWTKTLTGTADIGVRAGAATVAVDAAGFVFVAGTIGNKDTSADFALLKLNGRSSEPRVVWKRIFDSGLGRDDIVHAMTLTPDGGMAIAGAVSTDTGGQRFYLMKLTEEGRDAWQSPQILGGTNDSDDLNGAAALDVLENGDIAAVGSFANSAGDSDLVVGRFDGVSGERRWFLTISDSRGDTWASAVKVASNDDGVVGGGTWRPGTYGNFTVWRFNGAGSLLWQSSIDGGFSDRLRTVALAPNGDVIAGGTLDTWSGTANAIFSVVSLDSAGRERWRYESPGVSDFLGVYDIAFDADGNPVVTGETEQSDEALTTFSVIALDAATGEALWSVPIVGTASFTNTGVALKADPRIGAIVAIGVTQNEETSSDITVTSITQGHENWRRTINGRGKRGDRSDAAVSVAVDAKGTSVALAGYAQNIGVASLGAPQDFRVVKIAKNGTVAWTYDLIDKQLYIRNAALAVIPDSSGDFFAAGRSCAIGLVSCFTVVKIGRNGKEKWRSIPAGTIAGRDEARAIIQDPQDGNIIVAGNVKSDVGDLFAVFKLDAKTGAVLWPQSIEELPLGRANALTLTSRGTVAVAGTIESSFAVIEFDTATGEIVSCSTAGPGTAESVAFDENEGTVIAAGSQRLTPFSPVTTLAAKFASNGQMLWSHVLGEAIPTLPVRVAVHEPSGKIAAITTTPGESNVIYTVVLLDAEGNEEWRTDEMFGIPRTIGFAKDTIVTAGELREGGFAVIAFALDKTEEWRCTPHGTSGLGSNSAYALTVDDKHSTVFVAGVINNNLTINDMFAVGLRTNGKQLPASH
jgi:hypothetical protein